MKTRIIHTKFWTDPFILEAPKDARYLFNYLITSPHINISGIFELADRYILLETGLTAGELTKAKEYLESHRKVLFSDGWIKVMNAEKHTNYRNSPDNEKAYRRELNGVPEPILKYFDSSVDSTVGTPPTLTINNKQEIINNKERVVKGKQTKEELRREGMALAIEKIPIWQEDFPELDVTDQIAAAYDWLRSENKFKTNYVAFCRNWLRRSAQRKEELPPWRKNGPT